MRTRPSWVYQSPSPARSRCTVVMAPTSLAPPPPPYPPHTRPHCYAFRSAVLGPRRAAAPPPPPPQECCCRTHGPGPAGCPIQSAGQRRLKYVLLMPLMCVRGGGGGRSPRRVWALEAGPPGGLYRGESLWGGGFMGERYVRTPAVVMWRPSAHGTQGLPDGGAPLVNGIGFHRRPRDRGPPHGTCCSAKGCSQRGRVTPPRGVEGQGSAASTWGEWRRKGGGGVCRTPSEVEGELKWGMAQGDYTGQQRPGGP